MSGKGTVRGHQNAPSVGQGQADRLVSGEVGKVDRDAEVDQSFVEAFDDRFGVTAEKAEADAGIVPLQSGSGFDNCQTGVTLSASELIYYFDFIRRCRLVGL